MKMTKESMDELGRLLTYTLDDEGMVVARLLVGDRAKGEGEDVRHGKPVPYLAYPGPEQSAAGIDLSGEWKPANLYPVLPYYDLRAIPSYGNGARVSIASGRFLTRSFGVPRRDEVGAGFSPSGTLRECTSHLKTAQEDIVESLREGAAGGETGRRFHYLRAIGPIRDAAERQCERHVAEANDWLSSAQYALAAWARIGVNAEVPEHGLPTPTAKADIREARKQKWRDAEVDKILGDEEQSRPGSEPGLGQEYRELAGEYSPLAVFLVVVEDIWTFFLTGSWEEPRLARVGMLEAGAIMGIPEMVTRAQARALDQLYRNVLSVDRALRPHQALQAACEFIEAYLLETGRLPTKEEMEERTRGPGRHRYEEKPLVVMRTLDAVVEWLDTDPPPTFVGDKGLANHVAEALPHLTVSGAKSRVSQLFARLHSMHPEVFPDMETGMRGDLYVEKAEQIRKVRDWWKDNELSEKD